MDNLLGLLVQISHGIAVHFGKSCEVVIHDLKSDDLNNSIVYIENGHVSNRSRGDGPSGIVLKSLQKKTTLIEDKLSYLTKTEDGRILKSSTMFIRNGEEIRYIISLNYDITGLVSMDTALQSLINTNEIKKDSQPTLITHNINDLLDILIEQSVQLIGKPAAAMTKDEKITAIKFLNDAGAFLVTRSGDKVSQHFGISKFTLYSYIDAAKQLEQMETSKSNTASEHKNHEQANKNDY